MTDHKVRVRISGFKRATHPYFVHQQELRSLLAQACDISSSEISISYLPLTYAHLLTLEQAMTDVQIEVVLPKGSSAKRPTSTDIQSKISTRLPLSQQHTIAIIVPSAYDVERKSMKT
jgi:hypothetical protein